MIINKLNDCIAYHTHTSPFNNFLGRRGPLVLLLVGPSVSRPPAHKNFFSFFSSTGSTFSLTEIISNYKASDVSIELDRVNFGESRKWKWEKGKVQVKTEKAAQNWQIGCSVFGGCLTQRKLIPRQAGANLEYWQENTKVIKILLKEKTNIEEDIKKSLEYQLEYT